MKEKIIPSTIAFLTAFTAYFQDVSEEEERVDSYPEVLQNALTEIIRAIGRFEGQRLKGWAILSEELESVFLAYSGCFRLKVRIHGGLRLPLKNVRIACDKALTSTLGTLLFPAFLSALLSAYSMSEVTVQPTGSGYLINSSEKPSGNGSETPSNLQMSRDFMHRVNNYLGGIIATASLVDNNPGHGENAYMIIQSARQIQSLIKASFTNPDGQ